MPSKPSRDFNEKSKSRPHLYSVSVRPKSARKGDYSKKAEEVAEHVRALAAAEGFDKAVRINFDDSSLLKAGVFFMNAPEKFAAKVKKIEGVAEVEKPSDSKGDTKPRRPRPGARGRKNRK